METLSVTWCLSQKGKCANKPGSYLVQHTYRKAGKVIRAGTCQVRGRAMRIIAQWRAPFLPQMRAGHSPSYVLDPLSEPDRSVSQSLIPRRASGLMCFFSRQRLCVFACCLC